MSDADHEQRAHERRHRTGLRALIDEMMEQIRTATGSDAWTPEDRARAEADLARIMDQVRQETMSRARR